MANEDDPTVPVVCPECDTESQVPLSSVEETIESHNDRLHDGEDVAEIDPAITERVQDLVAEDLGLFDDPE